MSARHQTAAEGGRNDGADREAPGKQKKCKTVRALPPCQKRQKGPMRPQNTKSENDGGRGKPATAGRVVKKVEKMNIG